MINRNHTLLRSVASYRERYFFVFHGTHLIPFIVKLKGKVNYLNIKKVLLISIIILLGGCFVNQEEEPVNKAKSTVESYLNNNFEDINEIKFDKGDFESPMGGLLVTGIVNGKAKFSISLDDDFNVGSIGLGDDFPERKEECKQKSCDY